MVEPRKLTKLWVDTYGDEGEQVLAVFKPYLEAEHIKKVWHNYSFDRAVLWNHGIDVRGFGGDTMHMARLWDSNRQARGGGAGYSLASLSNDRKAMAGAPDDVRRDIAKHAKTSMKKLFGKRNRKKARPSHSEVHGYIKGLHTASLPCRVQ
jgi:DNA polymerase-1